MFFEVWSSSLVIEFCRILVLFLCPSSLVFAQKSLHKSLVIEFVSKSLCTRVCVSSLVIDSLHKSLGYLVSSQSLGYLVLSHSLVLSSFALYLVCVISHSLVYQLCVYLVCHFINFV